MFLDPRPRVRVGAGPGDCRVSLLVPGEEVGYSLFDGVLDPAGEAGEDAAEDFILVLLGHPEGEVTLAGRAAEDIEKPAFHRISLRSIICVSSGPVEMRVTGQPISSSAWSRNSRAFPVSFPYSVTP